jgi:hypothetical protein
VAIFSEMGLICCGESHEFESPTRWRCPPQLPFFSHASACQLLANRQGLINHSKTIRQQPYPPKQRNKIPKWIRTRRLLPVLPSNYLIRSHQQLLSPSQNHREALLLYIERFSMVSTFANVFSDQNAMPHFLGAVLFGAHHKRSIKSRAPATTS